MSIYNKNSDAKIRNSKGKVLKYWTEMQFIWKGER